MAQVAVQIPAPTPKAEPILREPLKAMAKSPAVEFDPEKHLSFKEQPRILSMSDIGMPSDTGISPVAISDPFPLFTEEAIQVMRSEVLTKEVFENCMHSTEFAACQIRAYCPEYAPFTYDAWMHPKTLSIVSEIAGVDLIPVYDIEISNVNISTAEFDDGEKKETSSDDLPATKWHYDSYPFVCVVMMSDASEMIGGETAIKKPTGEVLKVRGPQMGCAVVLQGRCINHQALAAHGGSERITAVTAFRPRNPLLMDTSVLTTIRPITNHSELYYQWTEYRVEVLQDRLRTMLKLLREQHRAKKPTNKDLVKRFLKEQEEWLAITGNEIM